MQQGAPLKLHAGFCESQLIELSSFHSGAAQHKFQIIYRKYASEILYLMLVHYFPQPKFLCLMTRRLLAGYRNCYSTTSKRE
ncbi:hypothetical protein MKW98_009765 [Papaver atlanticum]|uniref:Uncharacterized protein n=1 Tax=Papaver atlanticum TaxID=357466 RepID=A0AAD4SVC0_9MAGN|nr:hypothetical protein MKW98_009765 [Papaver atlanticum]